MSTDSSPEVLRGEADRRPSQSLFQVYYLGSSRVDRRCSSSVMPWIVEEHKLKTQEMKLLWLTPGTTVMECVFPEQLLMHISINVEASVV